MDKNRRKSIQRKAEAIFKKAEDREKAGGDYFETGRQGTLKLMLLMVEKALLEARTSCCRYKSATSFFRLTDDIFLLV